MRTRERVQNEFQNKFGFDYFEFCECWRTRNDIAGWFRRCTNKECPYKSERARRTAHHNRGNKKEAVRQHNRQHLRGVKPGAAVAGRSKLSAAARKGLGLDRPTS